MATEKQPLFADEAGFTSGTWTHGVSWVMAPKRFIKEWCPKIRVDSFSGERWVQYQPVDGAGAFFSHGKPCIRVVRDSTSRDARMMVGYHVERGYQDGSAERLPETVASSSWHWTGFVRCLRDPLRREALNEAVRELSRDQLTIWNRNVQGGQRSEAMSRYDNSGLDNLLTELDGRGDSEWLEVILGRSFTVAECRNMSNADLAARFGELVQRTMKIVAVVQAAVPN